MKIQKVGNSQNFGWRLDTHYNITARALEHFPNLSRYEDSIMQGFDSMKDSMLCTNILASKSISRKKAKAPFCLPKTPFDLYYKNLLELINCFEDADTNLAMKTVGETLQYLQDVANPLTTKKECTGIFKIFEKSKFEKIADKNPQFIDDVAKFGPRNRSINFFDIFYRTYKKSKNMPNPIDFPNQKNMPNFVKMSVEHAYDSTIRFLKRFEDFRAVNQSQKDEFLLQEVENSKLVKIV